MEEINFQLPVASYEVIVRIILGYYHAGADKESVSISTVSDATAMKHPNISANNKFFLSMGILERSGKGFQLTSSGLQLARILDYYKENNSPEVQSAWEDIVTKNDFLQRVTAAVRVRGKMDVEAFARHIALTSGAPNKSQSMTGARTVITILQIANKLVEGEDGTLRTTEREQASGSTIVTQPPRDVGQDVSSLTQQIQGSSLKMSLPFTIMVQITPQTTDDELEELARKIKYFSELINPNDSIREEVDD